MDIDALCDQMNSHVPLLHDPKEAYEELSLSKELTLEQFSTLNETSLTFLKNTKRRYEMYLKYINFPQLDDAGIRIKILIDEFLSSLNLNPGQNGDCRLYLCKCQVIDLLLLDLVDKAYL